MATTDPEPPRREAAATHRCLCRLVSPEDPDILVDSCMQAGVPMDQPLCDFCLSAGHGDLPHVPFTVTAARQRAAAARRLDGLSIGEPPRG